MILKKINLKNILKIKNKKSQKNLYYDKNFYILIGIIVLGLLIVLFQYVDIAKFLFAGKDDIISQTETIKSLQLTLQNINLNLDKSLQKQTAFIRQRENFWIQKEDGIPNLNAPKIIENEALSTGVEIKTIGIISFSPQKYNIGSGEFDINCIGSIKSITNFINKINNNTPRFYWASFNLRPENLKSSKQVVLVARLYFIIIENEEILKLLGCGKK